MGSYTNGISCEINPLRLIIPLLIFVEKKNQKKQKNKKKNKKKKTCIVCQPHSALLYMVNLYVHIWICCAAIDVLIVQYCGLTTLLVFWPFFIIFLYCMGCSVSNSNKFYILKIRNCIKNLA